MTLRPITLDECLTVRLWRNDPDVLPMLRTGFKTQAEQVAFYHNTVCNLTSPHRYWAIEHQSDFIGMGGLTHYSHVRNEAEISLILGPKFRGRGLGSDAVDLLFDQGRAQYLSTIIGECYRRSPALGFWERIIHHLRCWSQWRGDSLFFGKELA